MSPCTLNTPRIAAGWDQVRSQMRDNATLVLAIRDLRDRGSTVRPTTEVVLRLKYDREIQESW